MRSRRNWRNSLSLEREQYENNQNPLNIFDLNKQPGVWSRRLGSDVTSQKDFRRALECGLAAPLTGDLTLWLSSVPLERSRTRGSQLNVGGGTRGALRQALVDTNIGN